ncbi:E3 ubiquitin-protein ligase RNF12-B [Coregonus clupeaformis]|uniref:E3 ubiquitin-protein ligase RNF12-B n=1 Tax=Coregonus clupeaformis TaxID=59861 RepID=UPI001E1C91D7|nr:E3 ubiquitin-protein ligase RNF12-B [Coregonus clupeaformis]XP_041709153.2 E3 ubiquitin-protein ligase RNF12-B [Coregonus clupeaformis]
MAASIGSGGLLLALLSWDVLCYPYQQVYRTSSLHRRGSHPDPADLEFQAGEISHFERVYEHGNSRSETDEHMLPPPKGEAEGSIPVPYRLARVSSSSNQQVQEEQPEPEAPEPEAPEPEAPEPEAPEPEAPEPEAPEPEAPEPEAPEPSGKSFQGGEDPLLHHWGPGSNKIPWHEQNNKAKGGVWLESSQGVFVWVPSVWSLHGY